MSVAARTEQMRQIRDELLDFKISPLYQYRVANKYFPVIGEGSHEAKIMFIGEAPGKNEALTGKPFCGASGKILDTLLESAGIARADVYVTNIVKDRPPENRDPTPGEITLYTPFLDRQINILEPQIIATLGRFAMKYIMEKFGLVDALQSITANHGRLFEAKTDYGTVKILPLYHPAVAVYDRSKLDELKQDFQKLKEIV